MTELERKALLGDKQAQQECTEKGIWLCCPLCKSSELKICGDGSDIYHPGTLGYVDSIPNTIIWMTCDKCGLISGVEEIKIDSDGELLEDEAEKRLLANWNTRPAPPIGRCVECKHSPLLSSRTKGMRWCRKFRSEVNPNDFCSNFKPRESEENENN